MAHLRCIHDTKADAEDALTEIEALREQDTRKKRYIHEINRIRQIYGTNQGKERPDRRNFYILDVVQI